MELLSVVSSLIGLQVCVVVLRQLVVLPGFEVVVLSVVWVLEFAFVHLQLEVVELVVVLP